MEKLENKIRMIDFNGAEQYLEFIHRVIEKQIGKSVFNFDEKDLKEAAKIGESIGESVGANFVKKLLSKDDEDLDYIYDHSVVITDENIDQVICVPMINLNELEKVFG
ncbi:MAG: hypothetical protein LIR46_12860 [Bacteroidota bacterium]|nr:hypothetical protein [Bacteroidota bacterium]